MVLCYSNRKKKEYNNDRTLEIIFFFIELFTKTYSSSLLPGHSGELDKVAVPHASASPLCMLALHVLNFINIKALIWVRSRACPPPGAPLMFVFLGAV